MNKTTKTANVFAYIFITLLGILLYYHIRGYGFTYLDDASLVIDTANAFSKDPFSILRLFIQNHLSTLQPQIFYRPVFAAAFMINSIFSKNMLAGYYLTNIALHIAASCLIFKLLKRLGNKIGASLILTSLYVVHPMLTQTVAWLPGRSDTLVAIFSIFSFISFLNFIETRRPIYYVLHLASLALALLSKENAISLVAVCFIYMRLIEKRKLFRMEIKLAAGWLMVLSLYFALRHMAFQNPLKIAIPEMAGFLATNSIVIVQYIGRIFWPLNLSVWPTIQDSQWIPGVIAIVIMIILLLRSKGRRMNYVYFGAAWFILFLLPALIRPSTGISGTFSNTRAYLSMAGIFIILAETDMVRLVNIKKWPHAVLILFTLFFYSSIAMEHSYDFRNSAAFWANARRTAPHSWIDPELIKE